LHGGFFCGGQTVPSHYGPAGINKDTPVEYESQYRSDTHETLHQVARVLATRQTQALLLSLSKARFKWIWDQYLGQVQRLSGRPYQEY